MDYVPILPLCRAYKQEMDKFPYDLPALGTFKVLSDQIIFIQAHPNTVHKLERGGYLYTEIAFFYDWFRVSKDIDHISPNGFIHPNGLWHTENFDLFKKCFVPLQNRIQNADRALVLSMKEELKLITPHLNALSYLKGFLFYFPVRLEFGLLSIPIVANPQVPEAKCFLKTIKL